MTDQRPATLSKIFDAIAPERDYWINRNIYFHNEDEKYLRFIIPENSSVIEIGCGTGRLLNAVKPSRGVGIDLSPKMIEQAQSNFPDYVFEIGDALDSNFLKSKGLDFN